MSFWWGYALGSCGRGGGAAGSGVGSLLVLGGLVAVTMELLTPAPPKEISEDEYKALIVAAGASCTGLSVVAHHLKHPGGIRTDTLSPIRDILIDRIQHGDREPCSLPPRPAAAVTQSARTRPAVQPRSGTAFARAGN